MSAAELLLDLDRLGIRVEAHGERLRYSPRSALTPDVADRVIAHKAELLSILGRETVGRETVSPSIDPPDAVKVLRAADARWAAIEPSCAPTTELGHEPLGQDNWPPGTIDPDESARCLNCGTLEMWQTLIGNWLCLRCNPPTNARRLAELAEKIRRRTNRGIDTRHKVQYQQ